MCIEPQAGPEYYSELVKEYPQRYSITKYTNAALQEVFLFALDINDPPVWYILIIPFASNKNLYSDLELGTAWLEHNGFVKEGTNESVEDTAFVGISV